VNTRALDILEEYGSVLVLGVLTAWFLGRQLTPAGAIVSPSTLLGVADNALAIALIGALMMIVAASLTQSPVAGGER
jgi:hypothetical protein